jgi:hypothetical protein
MYFYLPFFYITYLVATPILSPIVNPVISFCYYTLTTKQRPKKFDITNKQGEKILLYTSNKKEEKKIIDKVNEVQKLNHGNTCNIKFTEEPDDLIRVEETDECVILSTDMNTFVSSHIMKTNLDYVIIDCSKHIVYKENVFEEFFKYTGIDKGKFFKLYDKYASIVLDMKQNEIFTFI